MSKQLHPIRKMLASLDLHNAATTTSPNDYQRAVARHVKPLLDALEKSHTLISPQGPICPTLNADFCPVCRLLAAWRAKL